MILTHPFPSSATLRHTVTHTHTHTNTLGGAKIPVADRKWGEGEEEEEEVGVGGEETIKATL